ncbi:hypothetical protein K1719_030099 [Acacia pycnantha]|nr:hypothetical protein K1719_030099 [Acacia pycnantha]
MFPSALSMTKSISDHRKPPHVRSSPTSIFSSIGQKIWTHNVLAARAGTCGGGFLSRPQIQAVDPLSRGTTYGTGICRVWSVLEIREESECTPSSKRVESEDVGSFESEEVGSMVKSLESAAAARDVVNLSEVAGDLIENLIYRMILGCGKDDKSNLKGLVEEALTIAGQFNLVDYFPWLGIFDLQGLTRKKKNIKALDVVLGKIVRA